MCEFLYENIGTILNLLGTVMIAFSFGTFPGGEDVAYTTTDNGKKKHIAYFNYPILFWAGIIILSLGFILQLEL